LPTGGAAAFAVPSGPSATAAPRPAAVDNRWRRVISVMGSLPWLDASHSLRAPKRWLKP